MPDVHQAKWMWKVSMSGEGENSMGAGSTKQHSTLLKWNLSLVMADGPLL
jgi:hypothetical protein